jgi:hypothetical protein
MAAIGRHFTWSPVTIRGSSLGQNCTGLIRLNNGNRILMNDLDKYRFHLT